MKTQSILLAALGLLLVASCGDEEVFTGPVLPRGEWVKISTFACPDDAQTDEECTIPVAEGEQLVAGGIYVQEHHFINSDYLFGVLSWPPTATTVCDDISSEGRCVLFGVWGTYAFEHGVQRLVFRLTDPVEYRLDYTLMVGGHLLADTSLVLPVGGTPAPSGGPVLAKAGRRFEER